MTIRDIVVAFGFDVDRNSEKQAESSIKGLKSMATKLLGSIAVVFSVAKLTSFAKDCVQAASDVEEMENKFNVVFDHLSDEVDQWAEDFANSVGRNKNTIKTYLADQQNLLVGFGMTREEGAKLSEEMTTLALDIASFANLDEDTAVNAMTKAIMGQSESAKTLGAVLDETTRAETMLAMGLSGTYSELDQLTKMEVNYQTILRQSPDAIGDCVRSMDSYEARTRQLNSAIAEFKEFIGGQLLPIFAVFLGWFTQAVKVATAFAKAIFLDKEENNRLLKVFERIQAIVKKLQPAMERFAQSIRTGISRATDTVKMIADRLGGMDNLLKVLAIAAGAFLIAMNWSKIISAAKAFMTLLSGIGKLFSVANLKILAIVAVIVILALIVEDFINFLLGNNSVIGAIFDKMGIGADNARQAIFNAFNKIKEFLLNVWDFLKTAALMWINTIKGFFERHGESIRANFERAWGIIKTFLQGVWTFISQLAATLFGNTEDNIDGSTQSTKENLLSVWQAILDALSAVWDALYGAASAIFNALATLIETVFGWIQTFWNNWGSQVLAWFKVLWDAIGGILNGFLEVVKGVANFIASVFTGDWQGAWEAIKQIFTGIWDMIVSFITAVWETIKLLFSMALEAIKAVWEAIWNGIKSFFEMIWNGIVSFFQGIWNTIVSVVTTFLSVIQTVWNAVWSAISSFFQGLWNGIVSFISGIWSGIQSLFSSALSTISTIWSTVWTSVSSFFQGIWNAIVSFLSGIWSSITSLVTTATSSVQNIISSVLAAIQSVFVTVWNGIVSFFQGIWNTLSSTASTVVSAIFSVISSVFSSVSSTISSIWNGIKSFISGALSSISSSISSTFSNILSGITSTVTSIKDAIVNGFNSAISFIKGLPSQAVQWGADFIGGLKSGIMSGVEGIVSAVKGIGDKIRSFLHFSVPDEGPLTDYESWMPDFMGGMAEGIEKSEDTVLDKVKGVASGISVLMKGATASASTAGASTVNNTTSSITQNVDINNTYSGGSAETQKNVSRAMKKSAVDATTQMARGLAYARG